MPTLLPVGPYRFFMVMFDCIERPHIHVRGGSIGDATTVVSSSAWRSTARDLARIRFIVARNAEVLIDLWLRTCQDMTT